MMDADLTRLAAEKVMGWEEKQGSRKGAFWIDMSGVIWLAWRLMEWNPLTDWRAAGEIVEKLMSLGFQVSVIGVLNKDGEKVFDVEINDDEFFESDRCGPRAITIAALLAVKAITEDQL